MKERPETACVLVTGATGFLGRAFIPRLWATGCRIRAVYRGEAPPAAPAGIAWSRIEGLDGGADWTGPLSAGVTHLVHLAGLAHRLGTDSVPDSAYEEINHRGTARLAQGAAVLPGFRRFLFVSSIGAVCDRSDEPVTEASHCHPSTPYGRSKLAAEDAVRQALGRNPDAWCILRPPLLYGPGNPGNMARLASLAASPWPLPFGSIRNRRTFMYVENLADALVVALFHPAAGGKAFCVGDPGEISTSDLIRQLRKADGGRNGVFPFPPAGLRLAGRAASALTRLTGLPLPIDVETVDKLCSSLPVDSRGFCAACEWRPPFSTREGLARTAGRSRTGPGSSP